MNYLESVINNSGLCSGVLTKPDRIPPTEEENWLPFIRGEQEDITSWFCVKCPNTQAISPGVTWESKDWVPEISRVISARNCAI
jgi:hypothetical protein